MPEFTLKSVGEQQFKSISLYGKPSLLNLWFTNCSPCIDEIPLLNDIKSALNGLDINFFAITFQSSEEVSKFLENNEFNYKHLVDAKEYLKGIGIRGYPKTIILDKQMNVRKIEKIFPISFDSADKIEWKKSIKMEFVKLSSVE